MNKTKKDIAVDAMFLIALALVVIGLIINMLISRNTAEANCEHIGFATTAVTIEDMPEPKETETTTTEATEATEPQETEAIMILYDVPLEEDLQIYIVNLCEEKHIDPAIIMAMAFKESTYRADAVGDSGKSYGLLQIQPKWHYSRMQKLGCTDLLDPYQNVTVGIDYLAEQIKRYGGNLEKGLTAYNAGSYKGTVTKYAKSVIAKAEALAASSYSKAVSLCKN